MSKETGPCHGKNGIEVEVDDVTLGRTLRVLNTRSQICKCDGTASRVLACLNDSSRQTAVYKEGGSRKEWKDVAKATKWCAQGGLNKITECLTGENPEKRESFPSEDRS